MDNLTWEIDTIATIELTLHEYTKFQKLYKFYNIFEFLPEPVVEIVPVPLSLMFGNSDYNLNYVARISFEYKQCTDIVLIQKLFDDIKDTIDIYLYQHMSIFLEKDGKAYLNPFELGDYEYGNIMYDISNDAFDGTYWSAQHKHNEQIIDIHEVYAAIFNPYPKYSFKNHFRQTSVLKKYKISDYSINKLKQYPNLIYKFQDGHTHIWMNNDVVVKLSYMRILAEHETSILKLNIDVLPELVDSWNNNREYFIVMKNCGQPPNNIYGFSCLTPQFIIDQKNMITNKLEKLGFKHLDAHACNYVLLDNKLTIIDCEVIVDIHEYNTYSSDPGYKPLKYPLEYYKQIIN